jgi:hypothetical protein
MFILRNMDSSIFVKPWQRIGISDDKLRWWRRHWRALPLPRLDTVAPPPLWVPSEQFGESGPRLGQFERGTLGWVWSSSGEYVPCVAVQVDAEGQPQDLYDIEAAYPEARAKFDPLRSPHGAFRALEHHNHAAAMEFLRDFGLLFRADPDQAQVPLSGLYQVNGQLWMNLTAFWSRHDHYLLFSKLWEACSNPMTPPSALAELADLLEDTQLSGPLLVHRSNTTTDWLSRKPVSGDPAKRDVLDVFLKQWKSSPHDEQWLKQKDKVLDLVESEVNLNAGSGCVPCWRRTDKLSPNEKNAEDQPVGFQLTLKSNSLWAAMWELFARDTVGLGWRVCVHCGRLFYPPRKDRFFCTSELQQRHSKRNWDERHRGKERRENKADVNGEEDAL